MQGRTRAQHFQTQYSCVFSLSTIRLDFATSFSYFVTALNLVSLWDALGAFSESSGDLSGAHLGPLGGHLGPMHEKDSILDVKNRPRGAPEHAKNAQDRPKPFPNGAQDPPKANFDMIFYPLFSYTKSA